MTEKDSKLPRQPPSAKGTDKDRRRSAGPGPDRKPRAIGSVGRDELGNAVWEWRVDVPRRRDDDPTIDLLDCLQVDGLSIEEEEEEKKTLKRGNFNPYNKPRPR
jgi:hypothetical protein